jgi:TM2 domain-containing membrane protein YozV
MMPPTDAIYTANMTDQQRAWFYAEYQRAAKDELVGVLLALFLGGFGIHHFYLRRDGLGVLYLIFSWTGIPTILGFIECFFMPARVRQYNALQATHISTQILTTANDPAITAACPACQRPNSPSAIYCIHCGAALPQAQPYR